MAATGYTPIYLYYSSTATNAPVAGNLGYGELAINITDKNLFFKDNANAVNTVPIRQSSASSDGWLSSTDWSTFNSKQPAGAYLTSVTSDAPLTGAGTSASHLSMPAATGSVNGYLTSTDWTTFNSKQPAGTYVTSVSGTAPVVSSGGTTPAISMAAATGSVNGYLTSTDWTTFNGKQAALVSGTNIKTVGGVTLLGSGDVSAPSFTGNVKIGSGAASNSARLLINNATNTATGTQVYQDGIESWIIGMDANSGIYKWKASGSTKLELNNSTSDVTVSLGNLVIGTSGKGIDFSATAGTGTSELLADYEEGTWTPTLTAGTGSITSYTATGLYTKVGRLVTVVANATITDAGTGAGALTIGGLPYTNGGSFTYTGAGRENAVTGYMLQTSITAGTTDMVVRTYANATPIATNAAIRAVITYSV